MTRTILTLAALAGAAGACAPDWTVSASDVESPTGLDSGEPFLSSTGDAVYLSWLEAAPQGGHDLKFARWDGSEWSEAAEIEHSERFFVNWADFPSVNVGPDGALWAHWLERGEAGGYDYGVRVVSSRDGGRSWSEPWTPHDDDSPTEHGFVSALPVDGGMGFVWLDGRKHAEGADGSPATGEMTLRYRAVGPDGAPGPETLLDARVCDCCQTDAAMTTQGPVVVYRDRSEAEIRDIYLTRLRDGSWSAGGAVHEDGWHIEGCPVNGPAVSAHFADVAVAWFTGAGDVPIVNVAFSGNAGGAFGDAIRIDDGDPSGRVDVLMLEDGSAIVTWLERVGRGQAEVAAEVRMKRVSADGTVSESVALTESSSARASGFPRMTRAPDGSILVAWTDVIGDKPQVLLKRVEIGP